MKIGQISVCQQNYNSIAGHRCCSIPEGNASTSDNVLCKPTQKNVAFNGKFGAWVGGILGGAAVVAGAIAAAVPAAVCLLGAGAVVGAIGGHAAEDAVNGKTDDNN